MELYGLKNIPRVSLLLFVVAMIILIVQLLFLVTNKKLKSVSFFIILQLIVIISLSVSLWYIYQQGKPVTPQQAWHGMEGPGIGWL